MSRSMRPVLFFLFFVSGFCGLVYQVVWTRMAFASFGIITPVLSVVLSVFMLGLALGSWAGGRWIEPVARRLGVSGILFYAGAELIIGLGAFTVPKLFAVGERLLLAAGQSDSVTYLVLSGLVLAVAILPWCVCMGTTYPLMMAYVREQEAPSSESFSYLYLANVLGAMGGALVTALVLVEVFGFGDTLRLAAAGNFLIALLSLWLMGKQRSAGVSAAPTEAAGHAAVSNPEDQRSVPGLTMPAGQARLVKWILFTTGFAAMAMEVVWTRAFAPVLKTQVYSFAMVVATYLGATFVGSLLYRAHLARQRTRSTGELMGLLCAAALLPIVATDTHLVKVVWWEPLPDVRSVLLVLASICPFCGILGYLTPGLVDQYGEGSPKRAGAAYALNVLGCILGPLFACYLLLPAMSERYALILLGLPFCGFGVFFWKSLLPPQRLRLGALVGSLLAASLLLARSFEERALKAAPQAAAHRDYAASVLSLGRGSQKALLVNGFGMTVLTPVTKFMSHLPLALCRQRPESALVICFGMGTSYRSALSWDVETTAVELIPSVKDTFGFYHADAAAVLQNPKGRIVIDDGRRYLARTRQSYDVIVVDPPPPAESAGSSLLYSTEFYQAAKRRLKPNGILQAWIPEGRLQVDAAALRSVCEVFPYVRCFVSVEGWGLHMLASMNPIAPCSAQELVARMPERARKDLLEWKPGTEPATYLKEVLAREQSVKDMLEAHPGIRITDDEPFNEYFLLRRLGVW